MHDMTQVLEGIMALLMPEDIISLSKTCKVFSRLAQSEQVWSTACLKTSGVKISPAGGCAKKFYKEGKSHTDSKSKTPTLET